MLIHVISHPCTLNYARRYRSSHRGPIGVVARQRETRAEEDAARGRRTRDYELAVRLHHHAAGEIIPAAHRIVIDPPEVRQHQAVGVEARVEVSGGGGGFCRLAQGQAQEGAAEDRRPIPARFRGYGGGAAVWVGGGGIRVSGPCCCPLPFPWVPAARL